MARGETVRNQADGKRRESAKGGGTRSWQTGCWSGVDLNPRDPSIQAPRTVVSTSLAKNWPYFLVADAYSGKVGMPIDGEAGVSSKR
jgi:hypothetical protein